jgi:hypothetical protein
VKQLKATTQAKAKERIQRVVLMSCTTTLTMGLTICGQLVEVSGQLAARPQKKWSMSY